jgi:protein-tyrosine phosphatase
VLCDKPLVRLDVGVDLRPVAMVIGQSRVNGGQPQPRKRTGDNARFRFYLVITNFLSAQNRDVLAEHKIQAILCLDREVKGDSPETRGVQCIQVAHLVDGPNEMIAYKNAVETLEELIGKCQRVVVHCRAGRSRSVAVVAAYLKKAKGLDAGEALELVRAKRESAIADELVRLVERFGG